MTNILCFGDSNTWGGHPVDGSRFGRDIRWPGALQTMLGDDYYIVEEGLNGRTTDLDDQGSHVRNGLNYLPACIKSHDPLDILIIMLGTNDLKDRFRRTAADVAKANEILVLAARENTRSENMKVLLISPALPNPNAPGFDEYQADFTKGYEKSLGFAKELKKIAVKNDCLFLDAAPIASVGEDGLHLSEEGHKKLAVEISKVIVGA